MKGTVGDRHRPNHKVALPLTIHLSWKHIIHWKVVFARHHITACPPARQNLSPSTMVSFETFGLDFQY